MKEVRAFWLIFESLDLGIALIILHCYILDMLAFGSKVLECLFDTAWYSYESFSYLSSRS